MTVIRAFIAIDLTPEILHQLDHVSGQIRQRLGAIPVRWVPASNIHLTLKFLGDVSVANLDLLRKVLKNEASEHHTFEISVGGIGAYPNSRRPRVIWAGVEAPPDLLAVQGSIEAGMERLGYAREERAFSPHLTMGRVSRNATAPEVRAIGDALDATKVGFMGAAHITEIHLYRSDLHPNGAVYTRIFSAALSSVTAQG